MAETTGIRFDENATCEKCGCFGAYGFDGKVLCLDCYGEHGSCCSELEARKQEAVVGPRCETLPAKQETRKP
jgi:hypothetical protein